MMQLILAIIAYCKNMNLARNLSFPSAVRGVNTTYTYYDFILLLPNLTQVQGIVKDYSEHSSSTALSYTRVALRGRGVAGANLR